MEWVKVEALVKLGVTEALAEAEAELIQIIIMVVLVALERLAKVTLVLVVYQLLNAEEAEEEKVEVEVAKLVVEALHLQSLDLLLRQEILQLP